MASIFSLLVKWFILCSFSVQGSQVEDVSVAHVYADIGSNVSLPCLPQSLRSNREDYRPSVDEDSLLLWIREGKALQHSRVETNGILVLTKITKTDAGLYTCQAEQSYGYSDKTFTRKIAQVELHVKSMCAAQVEKFQSNCNILCSNTTSSGFLGSLSIISLGPSHMEAQ